MQSTASCACVRRADKDIPATLKMMSASVRWFCVKAIKSYFWGALTGFDLSKSFFGYFKHSIVIKTAAFHSRQPKKRSAARDNACRASRPVQVTGLILLRNLFCSATCASHHLAKNSRSDCFLYAKCLLKLQVLPLDQIPKLKVGFHRPLILVQWVMINPNQMPLQFRQRWLFLCLPYSWT